RRTWAAGDPGRPFSPSRAAYFLSTSICGAPVPEPSGRCEICDMNAEANPMAGELQDKKVAVLATDGVEQVELTEPVKALKAAGAQVEVVSDKQREIQGFKHHD